MIKLKKTYLGLALYFVAVGVFSWFRTGSFVPFAITGGAGVITALIGYRLGAGSRLAPNFGLGWLVAFAGATLYSAFGRISAHTQTRPEARYLFLSMALLCLAALVLTIREMKSRRSAKL